MASPERYRVYALLNFVGLPLTRLLGYTPGWSGLGEDLPQGRVRAMGRLGHERALSVHRSRAAGLSNFANYKGALRALCLADDPWATRPAVASVLGIFRDRAGNSDHHARRCRRGQNRPFRFFPRRAPRHAVAGCRGMDPGIGSELAPRVTRNRCPPRKQRTQYAGGGSVNLIAASPASWVAWSRAGR